MTTLKDMIGEAGSLFAGVQTVVNGKTLREVKPDKYAPTSYFAKWLEELVNHTIKNAKMKDIRVELDLLLDTLHANKEIIPLAQNEVEKAFVESFGAETMKSNPKLDKTMGKMIITKLSVIAKQAGINELEVETVKSIAIRKVLNERGLIQ